MEKIRKGGALASDVYVYVDDGRPVGHTRRDCWQVSRKFGSKCSYYGVQDASRKVKGPDQQPGPWARTMVFSDEGVDGLISDEKWQKTRGAIKELVAAHNRDPKNLIRAWLESIRGFLIYVARTYKNMRPYLKGLHLTIDSWRPYRNDEGWKLAGRELVAAKEEKSFEFDPRDRGPETVKAVKRLGSDLKALSELTASESPPRRPYQSMTQAVAYLLGDASGGGFGSALLAKEELDYEAGEWREMYRGQSSNWREAENLVGRIENSVCEGRIKGCKLFVFTDNFVFEMTYYNGTSSEPGLFELTLCLHKVEMFGDLKVHVIHMAGTRMKVTGIDGLSRGDLLEGILTASRDPLKYIPLNLGAIERSGGKVETWVRSWWGGEALTTLTP